MEGCKRLWDYSYSVEEVNQNLDKGYTLETAIKQAMDACVEKGVLLDILEKSRNEVYNMLLTEYDEKLHMKILYEQGREEGRTEGREDERERINKLYSILLIEKRTDDLAKAVKNPAYLEELLKEYDL